MNELVAQFAAHLGPNRMETGRFVRMGGAVEKALNTRYTQVIIGFFAVGRTPSGSANGRCFSCGQED